MRSQAAGRNAEPPRRSLAFPLAAAAVRPHPHCAERRPPRDVHGVPAIRGARPRRPEKLVEAKVTVAVVGVRIETGLAPCDPERIPGWLAVLVRGVQDARHDVRLRALLDVHTVDADRGVASARMGRVVGRGGSSDSQRDERDDDSDRRADAISLLVGNARPLAGLAVPACPQPAGEVAGPPRPRRSRRPMRATARRRADRMSARRA